MYICILNLRLAGSRACAYIQKKSKKARRGGECVVYLLKKKKKKRCAPPAAIVRGGTWPTKSNFTGNFWARARARRSARGRRSGNFGGHGPWVILQAR